MLDKANIQMLIKTLKGVMPANYESMDRLVACVSFLEATLLASESKKEEGTTDG